MNPLISMFPKYIDQNPCSNRKSVLRSAENQRSQPSQRLQHQLLCMRKRADHPRASQIWVISKEANETIN